MAEDTVPAQTAGTQATPGKRALSRDLSEFLVELSIALHKHAMYPPGHPMLAPAVAAVARRAGELLEQRGSLSLGVARDQLIIEGVATDPRHPVLGELAGRLHRHHIGAITLYRGVEALELAELMTTLAVEADRTGKPLGLRPADQLPSWPHARLHPLAYERLELVEEPEGAPAPEAKGEEDEAGARRVRGAQLWVGLARAALAGQLSEEEAPSTKPAVVAQAINEHPRAEGYDQVIVGYLLQIADELREAGGEGGLELRRRTSRLIRELKPETLKRLVEMGGDAVQRRRFVADAADGLSVDAVVDILKAAAEASHQSISHSLVRMLNKLAAHAEGGRPEVRTMADVGLRDQVKRLLVGWELEDPNPAAYGAALQRLATSRPLFTAPAEPTKLPEAERILQMSLEVAAVGPIVWRAVEGLVEDGRIGAVLDLVDEVLAGGSSVDAALAIRARVATPERAAALLVADPPDFALLDRLFAILGPAAADPLLDVLATTQSRTVRRGVLERAARLGPAIAPKVIPRLMDERWYVVRNLLVLMEEWGEYPPGFSAVPYAIHPDHRVRRQALKLQLRLPEEREQAIAALLSDPDEHLARWGLIAVQQGLPETFAPLVERYARDRGTAPDLRALALKALGRTGAPSALETLLEATHGGRTLLGRPKLPPRSPELLAALRGLATGWSQEPRAAAVLARAAQSADADIRVAAGAAAA